MKNTKNSFIKISAICIILLFLLSSMTFFEAKKIEEKNDIIKSQKTDSISNTTYKGVLRIYIAEPISRWNMYDEEPYHYGFLDFAYNNEVIIDYQDTIEDTIIWDGDVEENNVIVIATVFNSKQYTGYAYPPSGNKFDAHFVDATAGSMPDNTGYNIVKNNFTHTVFIEEGTATWCHNCPDMANKLNNLYKTGEYPFYFVSLISDKNDDANSRLIDDYNVYGYPVGFFDGGKHIIIGGGISVNDYISRIQSSGERNVHELNLTLSVKWLGNGNLEISFSITNNEIVENVSPEIPIIEGPSEAKTGENVEYTISSNDPEGDNIYYYVEWGDNEIEDWFGPFESGSEIKVNHIWNEKGNYLIKVKTKDTQNSESDWGTIEVSMPLYYQYLRFIILLEKILR